MFYCNNCAEKNEWPKSIMVSQGLCECCGKHAMCNDKHSSFLPNKIIKDNWTRDEVVCIIKEFRNSLIPIGYDEINFTNKLI